MRVTFSEAVKKDLDSILRYIGSNNPRRAVSFVREIRSHCKQLGGFPESYPLLIGGSQSELRRVVHGQYLIFYRVTDEVEILRVLHGATDYESVLFPEEPDQA